MSTTPTNEAGHGLPEVAAAREVIRAYFAGELDDTMILNLSESLALSRGVPADMVLVPRERTEPISIDRDLDVLPPWPSLPEPWTTASVTYAEDGETCTQSVWTEKQLRAFAKACAQAALDAAAPAAAGAQGVVEAASGGEDIADAVMDPNGTCPTCYQYLRKDADHNLGEPQDAVAYRTLIDGKWWHFTANAHPADIGPIWEPLYASQQAAPQPAAADVGVRESARSLFDAMLAAPYGSTTMGDIVCAETTCNRLESAWLPILEAALSSHRQAGDDLSKFRELAEGWRQEAEDNKHLGGSWHRTDLCNTHADELLALVEKGAGNG